MKFRSTLKTLTFFNIELIIISICMVISISFGGFSLYNNVQQTNKYTKEISLNEKKLKNHIDDVNHFNTINNDVLEKSLQGKSIELENDIDILRFYAKKLTNSQNIDSLLLIKKSLLYRIANEDSINLDKFKTYKYVVSVNKYTEKRIFKKEIVYDTSYVAVPYLDKNLVEKNIINTEKEKKSTLKSIFKKNNEISNDIEKNLNKHLSKISKENSDLQKKYFAKINKNNRNYLIISFSTLVLFITFLYLLINDIKKKLRSEFRNKSLIQLLMKRK